MDFPILFRDEAFDLLFALHQDGQRGRLNASDRREMESTGLRVESGHGAGAIDAHEPVGFRTAHRRVGERLHRFTGAECGKTFADRRRGHGLQPEPLDGLDRFGVLDDVTENQFTLAPGVASIHELVHVLALDQLREQFEARLGFLDGAQCEMGRDDRQIGKGPLAALHLKLLGHGQFQQMTDRRGQHHRVALIIVIYFLEPTEGLGDIAGHRRLFSYD